MDTEKRLNKLSVGESGKVKELLTGGSMRRRFLDVGVSPGTTVTCVGKSPLGDPAAYLVRGSMSAIRDLDACGIVLE